MKEIVTILNFDGQEEAFRPLAILKVFPIARPAAEGPKPGHRIVIAVNGTDGVWIDTPATMAEIIAVCEGRGTVQ